MAERERLEALATSWGVLTEYTDLHGEPCRASDEALISVLHALGADPDHIDAALVERRAALAKRQLPPVLTVWQGRARTVQVPIDAPGRVHCADGSTRDIPVTGGRATLPGDLPPGLHTLTLGDAACTVISAPEKAWSPEPDPPSWGVFLPHHALHDAQTRGLGDATALARLGIWAGEHGASVLGTLPLLATFLGGDRSPYEPSPYAPVSRRFFGEHLIDPTAAPEWESCPAAQQRLERARSDGTLARLRAGERVDPAGAWALQRALLADLTATALADPDRRAALEHWVSESLDRALYAWFRAESERAGAWPTWPSDTRDPASVRQRVQVVSPPDDDAAWVWRYAQWTAWTQLDTLRDELAGAGVELYLDLPIGQHPDGFDTWIGQTGVFAAGISVGAPPDPYFRSGQDWGFPPALPAQHGASTTRDQAERAFAAGPFGQLWQALLAHTHLAHRLRLDHVMGLYRLYWVPRGLGAGDGVYVRYDADIGWALITLASHQNRCAIVGENLGMVPKETTAALERHAVRGMAIAQFSLRADPESPLAPTPPGSVASLNTHDTPTFAGWWCAEDLDAHHDLGWLSGDRESHERYWRQRIAETAAPLADLGALADADVPKAQAVAAGLYRRLADGPAHLVLVNLEDLWGETRPHNVPGTWRERPNWLRRSALSRETMATRTDVAAVLADLREARPR